MIDAIRSCFKTDAMKLGDVISCVYHSLAKEYKNTIEEIELMTNQKYEELYIVGGGSQDNYLNSLTKQYTGKRVFAGPTEATAIGNLVLQMIVNKELNNGFKIYKNLIKTSTYLSINSMIKTIVLIHIYK
jgi:sugar (pentulose or hexulose) kinase